MRPSSIPHRAANVLAVIRQYLHELETNPTYLDLTFDCESSPWTIARVLDHLERNQSLVIKRGNGVRNQYSIISQEGR